MPFISQSGFLNALGWAVINSIWQMALIWLFYKLFVLFFKPGSALKAKSSFILLVAGSVWTGISFITAFRSPTTSSTLFTINGTSYSFNDSISTFLPYASIIYLSLLTIPVIRFIINIREVILIRNKKLKKIEIQWRLFVKKMVSLLEIKKPVQVWISENISSPITIGFLKPVILIPLAAINNLTEHQLEAVLLHELIHIKRNDYLLNFFIVFIKTFFYYNPFTRNLISIIEDERERNCDEWVLQYQYDAYSYSSALLALEQMKLATVQLALAASGKKELLLNRIKKIMGVPSENVYSFKKNFAWLTGIACSTLLFLLLFSNSVNNEPLTESLTVSPFNYLQNENSDLNSGSIKNETTLPIPFVASEKNIRSQKEQPRDISSDFNPEHKINSDIIPVSFSPAVADDKLDAEKEMQVNEAVKASKKIIQEINWKEVNKAIADAMTEIEKKDLKKFYDQQIASIDFKKLEDKLRTSYDQLNWDNINARTNNALAEIKIDSLKYAYTTALYNIMNAKKQLTAEGLKGIPDSEITISELDASKKNVDKSLNKLRALKEKKIIRL
jgi:beta-lactamase regulating signal transducer with metallopeptidase domain